MSLPEIPEPELAVVPEAPESQTALPTPARHRHMLRGLGIGLAILLLGFVVPYVVPSKYQMGLLLDGVLLAILALSIGFLARQLGLISLGHTAFFGAAAYATGIGIKHWGLSPLPAVIVAVLIGTVVAVIIGLLVVRATGMGFLMLTLALGQALYQFATQKVAAPWTGAYDGLQIPYTQQTRFLGLDAPSIMNAALFWPMAWSALILSAIGLWLVGRSSFGTILEGIKENEERMRFSGFDTDLPRLIAFVISGFVASIGGALFALNAGYVSPELLSFVKAGDALTAAIIGGLGIVVGPILGSILYIFGQSQFNTSGNLHLWTGLALVLVLMFLPGGIFGSLDTWIRRRLAARASSARGKGAQS